MGVTGFSVIIFYPLEGQKGAERSVLCNKITHWMSSHAARAAKTFE